MLSFQLSASYQLTLSLRPVLIQLVYDGVSILLDFKKTSAFLVINMWIILRPLSFRSIVIVERVSVIHSFFSFLFNFTDNVLTGIFFPLFSIFATINVIYFCFVSVIVHLLRISLMCWFIVNVLIKIQIPIERSLQKSNYIPNTSFLPTSINPELTNLQKLLLSFN